MNSKKEPPSFWLHFSAGGAAGLMGAAITCPLEVVKTRLQSSLYRKTEEVNKVSFKNPIKATWNHMKGVVNILGTIRREEGIRALWKGLGPNLIGVVPARSIYFATYSQGKHLYSKYLNNGVESSFIHMLSAATAGASVALVTNPIWLVKTRMQLQNESAALDIIRYKNSFHCAYVVFKTEGIRALYKGFSASLVAIAKLGATLITYPHEVLRTRLRQSPDSSGNIKYKGLINSTKLILREEGIAAFYGGMTAHIMRVVPNAAILFFTYEVIVHWWQRKPSS
ncbi:hypothetical protein HDU92_006452 [Lobulomyces angularis]|nr:hypothetical protein HDU92_006452 [Lobulomyces angularis]